MRRVKSCIHTFPLIKHMNARVLQRSIGIGLRHRIRIIFPQQQPAPTNIPDAADDGLRQEFARPWPFRGIAH